MFCNKRTNTAKSSAQPIDAETPIIPVRDIINKGFRLASEVDGKKSSNKEQTQIKPIYSPNEYNCCPVCYVKKIIYPEVDKFKGCQHRTSESREGISRSHHLNLLAQPNLVKSIPSLVFVLKVIILICIFLETNDKAKNGHDAL